MCARVQVIDAVLSEGFEVSAIQARPVACVCARTRVRAGGFVRVCVCVFVFMGARWETMRSHVRTCCGLIISSLSAACRLVNCGRPYCVLFCLQMFDLTRSVAEEFLEVYKGVTPDYGRYLTKLMGTTGYKGVTADYCGTDGY